MGVGVFNPGNTHLSFLYRRLDYARNSIGKTHWLRDINGTFVSNVTMTVVFSNPGNTNLSFLYRRLSYVNNSIEKADWLRDINGTFVYNITMTVGFVNRVI